MKKNPLIAISSALAVTAALTFSAQALAWHQYYRGYGYPAYVGVGVGWHGGHWVHGYYGPRFGWWWVVGPSWYYYAAPIYPYPDAYVPPEVVQTVPSGPAPAQSWYYCDNPAGYYPNVTQCPNGWTSVPATPTPQH